MTDDDWSMEVPEMRDDVLENVIELETETLHHMDDDGWEKVRGQGEE